MRKLLLKRVILGACGAILALYLIVGASLLLKPKQAATSAASQPQIKVQQDPQLLNDAQQLGIDVSNVNLILDQPKTSSSTDGTADALFTPPNTIEVKSGLTKHVELYSFAHEYMHYLWSKKSTSERDQIAPNLLNFYNSDLGFRSYFDNLGWSPAYIQNRDNLINELDSIECANLTPAAATQAVTDYCNQQIPNRALLF